MKTRPLALPLLLLLLAAPLLSPPPALADARDAVAEAVRLKRAGRTAEALAKYEAALDADRGALAVPHDGLLPALLEAWKERAASGTPQDALRHAYLLDIAGHVEEARALYLRLSKDAPREVAERAEDNLAVIERERETYETYLATMRREAREEEARREAETEAALRERAAVEEALAAQAATAEATQAAQVREAELAALLSAAEAELAEAEREAWRTKRDWYGFEGARKWRAKPGEPERSYDNTLRRRYRQARSGRDDAAEKVERLRAQIEALRAPATDPGTGE